MPARHLHAAARDPNAAPICLLNREWAEQRVQRPDVFLGLATSETWIDGGAEYLFATEPGTWEQLEVFVREEGECCPFLAFDAEEEGNNIVLRVLWPEEVWK